MKFRPGNSIQPGVSGPGLDLEAVLAKQKTLSKSAKLAVSSRAMPKYRHGAQLSDSQSELSISFGCCLSWCRGANEKRQRAYLAPRHPGWLEWELY